MIFQLMQPIKQPRFRKREPRCQKERRAIDKKRGMLISLRQRKRRPKNEAVPCQSDRGNSNDAQGSQRSAFGPPFRRHPMFIAHGTAYRVSGKKSTPLVSIISTGAQRFPWDVNLPTAPQPGAKAYPLSIFTRPLWVHPLWQRIISWISTAPSGICKVAIITTRPSLIRRPEGGTRISCTGDDSETCRIQQEVAWPRY